MTEISPLVKVARDLREIETLYEGLLVQAVHKANDRLMPGGEAMVALAPVGSPYEWGENVAAEEFYHLSICNRLDHSRCHYAESEDDEGEPPLQTLLFWSEQWRAEAGYSLDRRPTISTEANFIRGSLDWAWDNEMHWDDFAKDVRKARQRLENLLLAGERAERGVPCLYDECRGVRLVRKMVPARSDEGEKIWRRSDWHCPRCKRTWDEDRYAAMVTAANEAAKIEDIDGEVWCTDEYAARQVGRSVKTIRTWVNREQVATVCILAGRRLKFVSLSDVRARHEEASRRTPAA